MASTQVLSRLVPVRFSYMWTLVLCVCVFVCVCGRGRGAKLCKHQLLLLTPSGVSLQFHTVFFIRVLNIHIYRLISCTLELKFTTNKKIYMNKKRLRLYSSLIKFSLLKWFFMYRILFHVLGFFFIHVYPNLFFWPGEH